MTTWPYEKVTPDIANWQNGWGFTFNPQKTVVMWQPTLDVQQYEQWDLTTRTLLRSGELDGTSLGNIFAQPVQTFGLGSDGNISVITETEFPSFDKRLTRYPPDASGAGTEVVADTDPEFLSNPDYARAISLDDGDDFIVMPSYSTGLNGMIYRTSLVNLDVFAATAVHGQIKGFVHETVSEDLQRIWALVVNGDFSSTQVGIWLVASTSGIAEGGLHVVDIAGTQASTIGVANGVHMGGAFYVLAGHGLGQKVSRIDPDTWTETHSISASDLPFNNQALWELTEAYNATTFMVGNQRRSLADLSLVKEYPYSNWGFSDLEISNAVWDPTNQAIFVCFADGDIGWLFLPARHRVQGQIRYIAPAED